MPTTAERVALSMSRQGIPTNQVFPIRSRDRLNLPTTKKPKTNFMIIIIAVIIVALIAK